MKIELNNEARYIHSSKNSLRIAMRMKPVTNWQKLFLSFYREYV